MRLSRMEQLDLLIFGNIDVLVAGITLRRRIRARLHAHYGCYAVHLPPLRDHNRQVKAQLEDDDEWRQHVGHLMARRTTWRMRFGMRPW